MENKGVSLWVKRDLNTLTKGNVETLDPASNKPIVKSHLWDNQGNLIMTWLY